MAQHETENRPDALDGFRAKRAALVESLTLRKLLMESKGLPGLDLKAVNEAIGISCRDVAMSIEEFKTAASEAGVQPVQPPRPF